MKKAMVFLSKALIRGLLIVVPVYFAVLLLLKAMKRQADFVTYPNGSREHACKH